MINKNKFENYKYEFTIEKLLNNLFLDELQQKRLKKIQIDFKKKNISRNYEYIISDIYKLFEINNFSTIELAKIYNLSTRSIQNWVKELNLKHTPKTKEKNISKTEDQNLKYKKLKLNRLPEEVEDFLNYLESIKGKSPNTIDAYTIDLRLFFRFLKIHLGIVEITNDIEFKNIIISDIDIDIIRNIQLRDLYAFLKFLDKERNNSSQAKARKVATLKSFFNFLNLKLKVIKNNPAAELESPKIEKRNPIHLDLNESLNLLNSMDKTDRNYYRDYCILTIFLNCGLRLSELCGIQTDNIRKDTLTVIGKGNKERTVYLNKACVSAINNYMNMREVKKIAIGDRNTLFISMQNRALSKRSVENLVKKHIGNSSITTKKVSPHKLRHTAATLMYKHGNVDIRALQSILGHESISTTQIYTHVDNEQLRDAANSNPLSNIKNEPDK